MSDNALKWWEEQPKLWAKLVPPSGQASTVQGELIRCTGKITDEAFRNGNLNWESGYEELVRFVESSLDDPNTFDSDTIFKIRNAAESIIRDFESPDMSGHGGPYYYLTEMAVRWCLENPDPVPHSADPNLSI